MRLYSLKNTSAITLLALVASIFLLTSCGTSKPKVITSKEEASNHSEFKKSRSKQSKTRKIQPKNSNVSKIIKDARKFEGTKYKYGGTTKRGMDCSGLVYVAFSENDIPLPRTSRAMSLQGKRIYLKEVTQGDLLFFETNKNQKVINHVGLVVEHSDDIYFIHSTTSSGVIISALSEQYWENNFVMARRVL